MPAIIGGGGGVWPDVVEGGERGVELVFVLDCVSDLLCGIASTTETCEPAATVLPGPKHPPTT